MYYPFSLDLSSNSKNKKFVLLVGGGSKASEEFAGEVIALSGDVISSSGEVIAVALDKSK